MSATSEAQGPPGLAVDLHQGPCQNLGMPHFAAVACVTGVAVEASVARQQQLAVVQGCLENFAADQVATLVTVGLLGGFALYLAALHNFAAVEMQHDYPSVAVVAAVVAAAAAEIVAVAVLIIVL